jgi:hypothetical protein
MQRNSQTIPLIQPNAPPYPNNQFNSYPAPQAPHSFTQPQYPQQYNNNQYPSNNNINRG